MRNGDKKRTFLICGHAQSGKTSIAEAILFKCNSVNRLGSVDNETSVSDYEEDEKKRKSSINLSILNANYKGNSLQFIDAPGYLDFIGELITSSCAIDFVCLIVDTVEEVGIGAEKAWNILKEKNIPCLFFINKLDKDNTDYNKTLNDIRTNLTKNAVSVGIIKGNKITNILKDKDKDPSSYNKIIELVAESNDILLEKYLETGKLTDTEFNPAFKKAIIESKVFPVIGGIATQTIGIDCLLDLIIDIMPSVAKSLPRLAFDEAQQTINIAPKIEVPFSAQVFKTVIDPFVGQLTIFRVFSGKLTSNSEFLNVTNGNKEKFGQLYILQGKRQIAQDVVYAGDIVAVAKLKNTQTQDTLCGVQQMWKFPKLNFPLPVYSASIKPKTRQDEDKISSALEHLTSEDLTCSTSINAQTKELIISGMGELHIRVIIDRMKRKYNSNVELGIPKIAYLETITKTIQVSYKHKKQTGGRGQYGDISIKVEPLERGKKFEFVNKIVGGAIPRNFIPSVEKGIHKAMEKGIIAGYPIVDIRITLFDGSYHSVDSSDAAFQIAANQALKKAFEQVKGVLLEPIMNVEITAPKEFIGQITGDINSRRGRVMGVEVKGKNEIVKAHIPLAEMFKYSSDLCSVTGGRGSYTMSISNYDIVPDRITQEIIKKLKQNNK